MNLAYYKSENGNFGDDLNPYLWNQLIPNFSEVNNEVNFVGIGSILLDQFLDEEKTNLIFGSGSRDFLYQPNEKYKLDIRFVRGPLTAKSLNIDSKFITDSAYCLALEKNAMSALDNINKKYEVSFMPYFRHIDLIDWKLVEKVTGIHIIFPTGNVQFILEEIAKSKTIIASAMHGAIVADVLRVPWKRVFMGEVYGESLLTSEFKWTDWLLSIGVQNSTKISIPTYTSYSGNKAIRQSQKLSNFVKIIKYFKSHSKSGFSLSNDIVYGNIMNKLNDELNLINR
ncbi:polysaccharide pyruvyl transferase family protein [Chryseobacterium sp. FH1]|uniref:polysaccharide pyruvyl transferase family protein n=1 Tax=Chryseobacterium sp. FH1 TaxID=1233951 RepID=UPI00069211E8|nr:polysaccharide pyruvyl transferase family protein [Chryseobacterium sp. FH1]